MTIDEILARHRPGTRLTDEQRASTLSAVLGPREALTTHRLHSAQDDQNERVIMMFDEPHRHRHTRRSWLPAAAAAVLVGAVALVGWHVSDHPSSGGAGYGAGAGTVCRAPLPAAWKDAYATTPMQIDGKSAIPGASDPAGDLVLAWSASATQTGYALQRPDGTVQRIGVFTGQPVIAYTGGEMSTDKRWKDMAVATTDARRTGWGVAATDGERVVLTRSRQHNTTNQNMTTLDWETTDVVLMDIATGRRHDVLHGAPVPQGWSIRTGIELYRGVVYWGATPRGDDHRGIVVGYDIAANRYERLAELNQFPGVLADSRGVAWPGGSVDDPDAPPALGPQLDSSGEPTDRLATDGDSYAWQTIAGDQTIVHWADKSGQTRTFRVPQLAHGSDSGAPTAVAGPFVFLYVNNGGQTASVLDTRTGAIAPIGTELVSSYPGHRLLLSSGPFEYVPIDATKLPALHC